MITIEFTNAEARRLYALAELGEKVVRADRPLDRHEESAMAKLRGGADIDGRARGSKGAYR